MKKINSVLYKKLYLQAEEAKELGLEKLASGIYSAIGPLAEEELSEYSYHELKDDVYIGLWKLYLNVMKYYDVDSAKAEEMHDLIEQFAEDFIAAIEDKLGVESTDIGPLEPKVPGEKE